MPKKVRTATISKDLNNQNCLISFFRKGALKKFIKSDIDGNKEEIDFMSAIKLFECKQDTVKRNIPKDFFTLLQMNKEFLEKLYNDEKMVIEEYKGSTNSNDNNILKIVKFLLKDNSIYTEEDEEFLQNLKRVLEAGSVSKKTIHDANREIKPLNLNNKMNIISLLKIYFSKSIEYKEIKSQNVSKPKEIILSEYFIGE